MSLTPAKSDVFEETPLIRLAADQLFDYFEGHRRQFDVPLELTGTPFQRAVWASLLQIPFGRTRTYGALAHAVGSPAACRAVGNACHVNPIAIIVPCHRVLGAGGTLTGYAGGLACKRALLALESRFYADCDIEK
ncbi:methylated-DNA--[protein]-cysteine S-methyltransferase [Oscillospiraceae bacterium WX1]